MIEHTWETLKIEVGQHWIGWLLIPGWNKDVQLIEKWRQKWSLKPKILLQEEEEHERNNSQPQDRALI